MARAQLKESRLRTRRRRRRVLAATFAALALCVILGALAWVLQAPFWRIQTIKVEGTETLATSTVEDVVQSAIAGDYLYLFPKDNVLIYPKSAIAVELLSKLPTLASVKVSADSFTSLAIDVVEREPKALWCGTDPTSAVPCFLLDESGTAYSGDVNFEGDAYKHYFGALVGSTTPKHYLTPATFRSLAALIDTIASTQKGDAIQSVWVDANQDVHATFASG